MHFSGNVKDLEGNKRLGGVKITAYKGGSVAKSVVTSGGGSYDFTIPLGEIYKVVFELNGYVSKHLMVNTKNITEDDLNRGELPLHFEITLFAKAEGVDFSFLGSSAVGEFEFDPSTGYMEFDRRKAKKVADQIQTKIDEMQAKRAQDELKVKNFNKLVAEGDKLYAKASYSDALVKYEEAKALIPDDPTILIKIEDTKKKAEEEKEKKRLEQIEKDYQEAITAGASAFKAKDYQNALSQYNKAAALKPNEQLPTNKIIEIEELLAKMKADEEAAKKLEQEYNNLITAGDNLQKSGELENAKSKFEEALKLKPGESYPQQKIAEITKLLADKEANAALEANYKKLIEEGEAKMTAKSYDEAKAKFQEALKLKPAESLPKTKIAEIDEILTKQKEAEQIEAKFKKLVEEGDNLFNQSNFQASLAKFEEAKTLKPDEAYPPKKIAEIKVKIEEEKKNAADQEKYDNYVAAADQLFESGKYKEAKDNYNLALGIKANAAYPISQIAKIDEKLKEQQAKEELSAKYEKLLAEAENLFNSKSYDEAKAKYKEASALKPAEKHPINQIATIDGILEKMAKEKAVEESYKAKLEAADALLNSKKYNEAKSAYQEAQKIKPGESYPTTKIEEIDQILLKEAENNKLEAQYQNLIKEADAFFASKNYQEAKSKYNDALGIKKDEAYPKQKLDEIEKAIAAEDEARKREEQYAKLIKKGDDLFVVGTFEDAKRMYEEALKIKPNESHPKSRIEEINKKLAGQLAEAEKEAKYKTLIDEGNALMTAKNYNEAKSKYEEALTLKANEPYPTDKINEINQILKGQEADKAIMEKFNKIVAEADALFGSQDYQGAKKKYEEALTVKQNEAYPKDQLNKIKSLMDDAEKSKNDEQYNKILAVADKYFGEENFDKATELYNRALTFKPTESYPKEKLAEIEKIKNDRLADLANQEKINKQYNELIQKADEAFKVSKFDFALAKYQEAKSLKPNESYPPQKIEEINKILQANASQAELDKKYKSLLNEGDAAFASTNYNEAIRKYEEALTVKPAETYPKTQIDLAKQRLSELANKDTDAQYNQFIKTADEDFNARNYEAALNSYRSAAGVKPDEVYPQNRIQEIQQILDDLAAQNSAQAEIDKQYNEVLQKADNFFNAGQYKEARTGYQRALSIKNEAYPANQIIVCDQKLKDLNASIDNKQYQKILDKADEYLGAENYEKALGLYNRALGFRPNDEYPQSKIAQINELLAKQNAGDVVLTDWGNKVDMDEDNLQLLIAKSQDEAKWKADTTVSNQKDKQYVLDQSRSENQYDNNMDTKTDILKIKADLKAADEGADQAREETSAEVVSFREGVKAKNESDSKSDYNISIKENRKLENFEQSRVETFEKSDDVRLDNELNVVAYNLELKNNQKEGDERNYDGAVKTHNQINTHKVDTRSWEGEADLNRQDNSRTVATYNYDLQQSDNKQLAEQVGQNYNTNNEIESVELEIENNMKDADDPRQENTKRVVTYNNGLDEKTKSDNDNQYNQIDGTKNDIIAYKKQTEAWKEGADETRQNNEMEVIAYNKKITDKDREQSQGYYDQITDSKNDIRDIQELITENDKTGDDGRQKNEDIVAVYTSDLDNKSQNDASKERDKVIDAKSDVEVLKDTKTRTDKEGQKISTKSADEVGNYTDDLVDRKNRNSENEKDKVSDAKNKIEDIKDAKAYDPSKGANKLAEDYPEGVTEEKFEKKNAKGVLIGYVTRRIVVKGDRGDVYEKIQTKYGTTYLKNGNACTEFIYNNESGDASLIKH